MEVTFKGEPMKIEGIQPTIGEPIPAFSLKDTAGNVISSESLKGNVAIISVFPDINTSVCDKQTRNFNEAASDIEGIQLVSVSKNSQDELKEWCAAKGLEVVMLPDNEGTFGEAFGLNLPKINKLARSVFVVTQEGLLAYKEIVPEVAEEPNYEAAVEAAKDLL